MSPAPEQTPRMTPLLWIFALCAVLGAALPWYYNIRFVLEHGRLMTPWELIQAGFQTTLSSSLMADFLVGSTAVLVWMVVEARRLGMRWWAYVLVTFLVAFACACPLFLLMRARRLQRLGGAG